MGDNQYTCSEILFKAPMYILVSIKLANELEIEVSLVVELHHGNILKLLGYCFQKNDTFLIYNYMKIKHLGSILKV